MDVFYVFRASLHMVHLRRCRPAISSLVLGTALFLSLAAGAARAGVAVVLNSNDDDISLIDTATYGVIQRVLIGKQPHHLFPTPDERYLIVGNTQSNELVFLDAATGAIVRRAPNIADPYQLRFSPDGRWFAVNGNRLNRVDLYRYATASWRWRPGCRWKKPRAISFSVTTAAYSTPRCRKATGSRPSTWRRRRCAGSLPLATCPPASGSRPTSVTCWSA